MKRKETYQIEPFVSSRIGTVDIGVASRNKHYIQALIELDVTDARKAIKESRNKGTDVSFNSWLIKCISKAVEQNKGIQGIRKGRRKIVVFDDIDISIMVEREVAGKHVPLPYIIRKTNTKTISEISEEINNARKQVINDESDYVLGEKKRALLMKIYASSPGFIRRYIWKRILKNPFVTKKSMGTVMITSVGMIGKINGWVIPKSVHPLAFAIGSIIKKPGVVNNEIEIREYLYVTITVDHDVIDGAPAVRILTKLAKMIEGGYGLE